MSDYEVGFGRPPRARRFQKGQSGNPKGRPKGSRNIRGLMQQELDRSILVKEGGRPKRMSKGEALVKTLVNRGIQGDVRAAGKVVEIVDDDRGIPEAIAASEPLSPADEAVLKAFLDDRRANDPAVEPTPGPPAEVPGGSEETPQ